MLKRPEPVAGRGRGVAYGMRFSRVSCAWPGIAREVLGGHNWVGHVPVAPGEVLPGAIACTHGIGCHGCFILVVSGDSTHGAFWVGVGWSYVWGCSVLLHFAGCIRAIWVGGGGRFCHNAEVAVGHCM
jgi:hypothetical protein